jgi:conjugative relaxase-like TrwC/TraI family protein
VTVSMRVMSAGDGYKYLLRTVAAGDGKRSLSTPLTRYYSATGTPPGRWMGEGLGGLGMGAVVKGEQVTETQLQLLIGSGRNPVTGEPLGRAYPVYEVRAGADSTHRGPDGATAVGERPQRRAVAGYDFTFSIPKSASVLWGVADAPTQARIVDAHHAAIAEVIAFMEREVAGTRTGASVLDGAVAQVGVTGIIATAFDHFDSRAGDPHLHTHVVISNKVQTVLDGKWRSLDGRPMHAAVVALSELHEGLFADALTRSLRVRWEPRERGRDRHPAWTITTVPEVLVAEFSTRSRHIDIETDALIDAYVKTHGHRPSSVTIMRLRAQATLSTRPAKVVSSLAELTAEWRKRAEDALGQSVTSWVRTESDNPSAPLVRAEDVPLETVRGLGSSVVIAVSEKRSTWRHWNLVAEASRQTMHLRFASASDRQVVIDLVVDSAQNASLRLTPPELAASPEAFQRDDGTSVFRPRHSTVYTSNELLDAESRLLERAADETGPRTALTISKSSDRSQLTSGGALTDDQLAVLEKIAGSGRTVDVLVGPAGAGKTTAMYALRLAWEAAQGQGSVVGLAPSAAAARVLGEDLGIATENLAKWWQSYAAHEATFRSGQLIIVDEASLAGTLSLDKVTAVAANSGAKVLLVGDHAQLQSVDAGGAFSLLVHSRADAPELTDVHRFLHEWEKTASLWLRQGNPESVDVYVAHDRVFEGNTEAMQDAAYEAWRADARSGKNSVLISDSNEAVSSLNARARAELILEGRVDALHEATLHDGSRMAAGDTIITRRNNRHLHAGRSWVRNGDRWAVVRVRRNGSVEVRRQGQRWGSSMLLPADYVRRHVELGYAVTSHRAQGITTDTAHVVVAPSTTRENLYVAMTRGRRANTAYVALDQPDVGHAGPHPGDTGEVTARSILYGVLRHVGAELSAHETIVAEQEMRGSIAQLAAEYETIAAVAQRDRWAESLRNSGLSRDEADSAIKSDAFGALVAELRRAEAYHFDIRGLLTRVVAKRGFDHAQDVAAIVHSRIASELARVSGAGRARSTPQLLVGLIPIATGPMDEEMRRALVERRDLIEARARAVLEDALLSGATWTGALGPAPKGSAATTWRQNACTVAAYRDRYGVTSETPLGPAPETSAQEMDAARARAALRAIHRITSDRYGSDPVQAGLTTSLPSTGIGF